jgi:dUTP pyrophosphatase
MDAKIIPLNEQETISKDEAKEILNNILSNENGEIDPIFSALGDLDSYLTIISLPEKEFTIMSEIVIQELEKALNNPNDRLILIQNLAAANLKAEDLIETYNQILKELDSIPSTLPANRIGFLKRLMITIINAVSETEGIPKRTIHIPIELCDDTAKLPTYARIGDAGMDIYANSDIVIDPGETKLIPTGVKVAIPNGYELQVRPKSGISAKTKLRVANTPGTIDSGYRDEVCVILENTNPKIKDITYDFDDNGQPIITSILHGERYTIEKGQKIAQFVLSEVPLGVWEVVPSINEVAGVEDRGGGFGSTGLK